ncbi:DUF3954 domain-containing protein [Planococcus sp. SE5232]|uniref:DUF3954 domain-containing protein n=1 Tax=unclassified Planococcus (in: firmicutes) TaxID=2662419 RepID=UPI003D6C6DE2
MGQEQTDNEILAKIKMNKNSIIIVKGGKIEILGSPPEGHGKQTITWADGAPIIIENYFKRKL